MLKESKIHKVVNYLKQDFWIENEIEIRRLDTEERIQELVGEGYVITDVSSSMPIVTGAAEATGNYVYCWKSFAPTGQTYTLSQSNIPASGKVVIIGAQLDSTNKIVRHGLSIIINMDDGIDLTNCRYELGNYDFSFYNDGFNNFNCDKSIIEMTGYPYISGSGLYFDFKEINNSVFNFYASMSLDSNTTIKCYFRNEVENVNFNKIAGSQVLRFRNKDGESLEFINCEFTQSDTIDFGIWFDGYSISSKNIDFNNCYFNANIKIGNTIVPVGLTNNILYYEMDTSKITGNISNYIFRKKEVNQNFIDGQNSLNNDLLVNVTGNYDSLSAIVSQTRKTIRGTIASINQYFYNLTFLNTHEVKDRLKYFNNEAYYAVYRDDLEEGGINTDYDTPALKNYNEFEFINKYAVTNTSAPRPKNFSFMIEDDKKDGKNKLYLFGFDDLDYSPRIYSYDYDTQTVTTLTTGGINRRTLGYCGIKFGNAIYTGAESGSVTTTGGTIYKFDNINNALTAMAETGAYSVTSMVEASGKVFLTTRESTSSGSIGKLFSFNGTTLTTEATGLANYCDGLSYDETTGKIYFGAADDGAPQKIYAYDGANISTISTGLTGFGTFTSATFCKDGYIYVGTHNRGTANGLYLLRMNLTTNAWEVLTTNINTATINFVTSIKLWKNKIVFSILVNSVFGAGNDLYFYDPATSTFSNLDAGTFYTDAIIRYLFVKDDQDIYFSIRHNSTSATLNLFKYTMLDEIFIKNNKFVDEAGTEITYRNDENFLIIATEYSNEDYVVFAFHDNELKQTVFSDILSDRYYRIKRIINILEMPAELTYRNRDNQNNSPIEATFSLQDLTSKVII